MHSLPSSQSSSSPPPAPPAMQASPDRHGSPLVQAAPSASWSMRQLPVAGSQRISRQSPGVASSQVTTVAGSGMQTPSSQTSVPLQMSPSS